MADPRTPPAASRGRSRPLGILNEILGEASEKERPSQRPSFSSLLPSLPPVWGLPSLHYPLSLLPITHHFNYPPFSPSSFCLILSLSPPFSHSLPLALTLSSYSPLCLLDPFFLLHIPFPPLPFCLSIPYPSLSLPLFSFPLLLCPLLFLHHPLSRLPLSRAVGVRTKADPTPL